MPSRVSINPSDGFAIGFSTHNSWQLARRDFVEGLRLWRLWTRLGWNDIVQRYRRSVLGPLWLTASMGLMVIALGVVYAQIFGMTIDTFMPFLCTGLLTWGFISTVMIEAGMLFTGSEAHIKQIRLPYTLYVHRFVWGKIIILAHNAVIYLGIIAYFRISPGFTVLYAIPGLALLIINAAFVGLYLGMASARFRDIPQIVASLVQIVFFLTPIMWRPELLGPRSHLAALNPFFHLVEIVREPLLGNVPHPETVIAVLVMTALNFIIAAIVFVRFRARIAYWV